METSIKIDIDDFLTEEEKKDYAVQAFKEAIKKELFKSNSGTIQSDSEASRIIGNITHEIVFKEVQSYIPDVKEKIIQGVKNSVNKNIDYYVFRRKDAWEKEESLAITYLNQEMKANEGFFKEKIRKAMQDYDLSEALNEELACKFEELASTMYSLAELFNGKK